MSPDIVLNPYLAWGEHLLWAGRPRSYSCWAKGCAALAFTAVLFGCVAWQIYPALQEAFGGRAHVWLLAIGAVSCPLILFVVRVNMTGGRSRTTYGLTDQRALVLPWRDGADVISVPLQGQRRITLKVHRNGTGTISFSDPGEVWWHVGSSEYEMTKTAFEKIDDARLVYELILDARVGLDRPRHA
jgi:hypothetical protein